MEHLIQPRKDNKPDSVILKYITFLTTSDSVNVLLAYSTC